MAVREVWSDASTEIEAWSRHDLVERLLWLIALRWVAVAGVMVVVAIAVGLSLVTNAAPLLLVTALCAAINWLFWRIASSTIETTALERIQRLIIAQLVFDLGVLTALLHWSGNVENPFVLFFVFPMAIAGMLLPRRRAYRLAMLATVLHGGCLLAEHFSLIEHHYLRLGLHVDGPVGVCPHWRSPFFIVSYIVAFLLTELGVVYFVSTIAQRLRLAEARRKQHAKVAEARERLARVGTLAVGVAHTVRNPLHGVMSCVEMLRESVGGQDSQGELVDLMSEGIDRIEKITSRLLTLAHDRPLRKELVKPDELVRDALRFVELSARKRGLRLEVAVNDVPSLEVDVDRLSEALANVLINAVQASAPGEVITVRSRLMSAGRAVRFEVEDTGHGIEPDDLKSIFEPFFTTRSTEEGTGLGLAIARRIVDEHGGNITIESSPGQGTLVRIDLPFAQEGTS